MVYVGLSCDRMPLIFIITRRKCCQHAKSWISEVPGGPDCHSNAKSETETYAANSTFM